MSSQALQPLPDRGWLNGFANLWRKELVPWWGKSFWPKTLLLWTMLTNGFFTLIGLITSRQPPPPGQTLQQLEITTFFGYCFMVTSIAVIVQAQGAIIGERQSGTAAWILSKPVSRPAFIVAKFAAAAMGLMSFLGLHAVIAYWNVGFWAGGIPSASGFFVGCAFWMLNVLFYLALTLMLGALFKSRGAVAGIAIGVLLLGKYLGAMSPFAQIGPFSLMTLAPLLALGQPVDGKSVTLAATTAVEIIVMVWVAAARFAKGEL